MFQPVPGAPFEGGRGGVHLRLGDQQRYAAAGGELERRGYDRAGHSRGPQLFLSLQGLGCRLEEDQAEGFIQLLVPLYH